MSAVYPLNRLNPATCLLYASFEGVHLSQSYKPEIGPTFTRTSSGTDPYIRMEQSRFGKSCYANPSFTTGHFGALGSDIRWNLAAAQNFLLELWVKIEVIHYSWILNFYKDGSNKIDIYLDAGGSRFTFDVNGVVNYTTIVPTLNVWYFLRLIRVGGKLKYFIDGIKNGADQNSTTALSLFGEDLWIGDNVASPGYGLEGYVANLRFDLNVETQENFCPPSRPYRFAKRDSGIYAPSIDTKKMLNLFE